MKENNGIACLTNYAKLESAPKAKRLFHELWTKAVGTPEYNKKEWQELERLLYLILD